MLSLSKHNSHNKKSKTSIRPYVPRLKKGVKSSGKLTGSTAALTPRKPEPESNSTAGSTWRLGWSPVERTFLLLGGRQDPKQQVLDTEGSQGSRSAQAPAPCTCKEGGRPQRRAPGRMCLHPVLLAGRVLLPSLSVRSPPRSPPKVPLPSRSLQISPNERSSYKITGYSSSSKVSRS